MRCMGKGFEIQHRIVQGPDTNGLRRANRRAMPATQRFLTGHDRFAVTHGQRFGWAYLQTGFTPDTLLGIDHNAHGSVNHCHSL